MAEKISKNIDSLENKVEFDSVELYPILGLLEVRQNYRFAPELKYQGLGGQLKKNEETKNPIIRAQALLYGAYQIAASYYVIDMISQIFE